MEREIKIESGNGEIRYWWVSLLVGLLSVAVGIWCIATPEESLMALTSLFICVLIAAGICNVAFAALNDRHSTEWGWTLTRGILELLLGIWLLALPLPVVAETLADRVLGIVLCRHRNRRSVRTAAVRCPRLGMVARMQHPVPDIIIRLPGDTGLRRFFHRPLCRPVLPLLRNIPDCIRLYPAPPGPRMTKLTEFRM